LQEINIPIFCYNNVAIILKKTILFCITS